MPIEVPGPEAIAPAFAAMRRERAEAFVLFPDPTIDILGGHFIKEAANALLPPNLPLFSCHLQLPIPLGMDRRWAPRQHVLRRDVADGTVQACRDTRVFMKARRQRAF